MAVVARLHKEYKEKFVTELSKELGLSNVMQVPRLKKIVINMGLGDALKDSKLVDNSLGILAAISGQKPVATKARKSIATYRLREGQEIGAKVTLRGKKMFEFLDRLINIALPRIRDFRGLSLKSFDGAGNITFGVKEQIIFPEVSYDKIDRARGMDITIVTSARNKEEAKALLQKFNMPFVN
jgi:large subunit ribosomal protein L5